MKGSKSTENMKRFTPYGYITPIIVLLLLFVVCSVVISIVLGFTKYNIINPPVFKGLDNYARLISDPKFLKSLKNTIKLMLVIVPLQTVLGIVLAVFLVSNRKRVLGRIANSVIFIPFLCSGAVVGVVWKEFLNGGNQALEAFFGLFHVNPAMFLGDAATALVTVGLIAVWKDIGYYAVIYSSGLLSISDTYYEAAKVDGAGVVKRFFTITLPLLKPTIILVFFLSVTTSFKILDLIITMTGGGPNNASTTLVLYAYTLCFRGGNAGFAMAISNVLLLITMGFALLQRRWIRKEASEI